MQLSILIVGKDPIVSQTLVEMVKDLGHQSLVITSPDLVLGALTAVIVDVMILDTDAYNFYGVTLAAEGKKNQPQLKIFLTTGSEVSIERTQFIDEVLYKPLSKEALYFALKRMN